MFYLAGLFRTLNPGGSITSNSERVRGGGDGANWYVGALHQRAGNVSKRLLLIKENY